MRDAGELAVMRMTESRRTLRSPLYIFWKKYYFRIIEEV